MARAHPRLTAAIAEALVDWGATPVEQAVFGTTDAAAIASILESWCRTQLGAEIIGVRGYHSSVGCTALVDLDDAARPSVAVKAYQPRWTKTFLSAARYVQRTLHDRGFPAPEPITTPQPLPARGRDGPNFVTVDRFVDLPPSRPTFDAATRAASAGALAELVNHCRDLARGPAARGLRPHPLDAAPGAVYPTPHSPLFDFSIADERTARIDELAREAQAVRDDPALPRVIAHTDWSLRNVRIVDGTYVMAFDWDSVALVAETTAIGQAAQTWSSTGDPEAPSFPDPDRVAAYVRDYETARGTPLTAAERRATGAAALYNLCYIARCELAAAHRWPDVEHGDHAVALLRGHGRSLLDPATFA